MLLKKLEDITASAAAQFQPEIEAFSGAKQLKRLIAGSDYLPDIAILDIAIGTENGIELAGDINSLCPKCIIIFISSFLDYALDVYDVRHSYFVYKPQLVQRLPTAVKKAAEEVINIPVLSFKENSVLHTVAVPQVIYLERRLRKTYIVCSVRQFETYAKPEELLKSCGDYVFIKCHQSFTVNAEHIVSMTGNSFIMANNCVVPISRSNQRQAKETFLRYIRSEPDVVMQQGTSL